MSHALVANRLPAGANSLAGSTAHNMEVGHTLFPNESRAEGGTASVVHYLGHSLSRPTPQRTCFLILTEQLTCTAHSGTRSASVGVADGVGGFLCRSRLLERFAENNP